jgi:hypothetical protein
MHGGPSDPSTRIRPLRHPTGSASGAGRRARSRRAGSGSRTYVSSSRATPSTPDPRRSTCQSTDQPALVAVGALPPPAPPNPPQPRKPPLGAPAGLLCNPLGNAVGRAPVNLPVGRAHCVLLLEPPLPLLDELEHAASRPRPAQPAIATAPKRSASVRRTARVPVRSMCFPLAPSRVRTTSSVEREPRFPGRMSGAFEDHEETAMTESCYEPITK